MMSIVLTLDLTILNKMSLDFFQMGWLTNIITEIGNAALSLSHLMKIEKVK